MLIVAPYRNERSSKKTQVNDSLAHPSMPGHVNLSDSHITHDHEQSPSESCELVVV